MKVREEVELSCCCEAAGTEWTLVKSESCLFVFFYYWVVCGGKENSNCLLRCPKFGNQQEKRCVDCALPLARGRPLLRE